MTKQVPELQNKSKLHYILYYDIEYVVGIIIRNSEHGKIL